MTLNITCSIHKHAYTVVHISTPLSFSFYVFSTSLVLGVVFLCQDRRTLEVVLRLWFMFLYTRLVVLTYHTMIRVITGFYTFCGYVWRECTRKPLCLLVSLELNFKRLSYFFNLNEYFVERYFTRTLSYILINFYSYKFLH